jgi:phosphatidylglycerol:prolipoprotein diacylglycerol transferase
MYPNPIVFGITLYDIMFFIGIFSALAVYRIYTDRRHVPAKVSNFYLILAILSICCGYLSAILFQSVYNFIETGVFRLQGMTFLGGLVGGVGVFLLGYKFLSQPDDRKYFPMMVSVAPCSILIAHFFGRIGCFFAGCCFGRETDSVLGMVFPSAEDLYGAGAKVLPTQLFEAVFLLVMFLVVSYVFLKDYRITMPVYLIGYGIFRFINEFFRGDDRGQLVPLVSPSQALSLVLIAAGIVLLIPFIMKRKAVRSPYYIN